MWTIDRIDGLLNLATIEEEEVLPNVTCLGDWPEVVATNRKILILSDWIADYKEHIWI